MKRQKYIISIVLSISILLSLIFSFKNFAQADNKSNKTSIAESDLSSTSLVTNDSNSGSEFLICYDDVKFILSDLALDLLSKLPDDSWGTLSESIADVDKIEVKLDGKETFTSTDTKLIEILLLDCAVKNNMFDDSQNQIAQSMISLNISSFALAEKSKYSFSEYSTLNSDSIRFGNSANKSDSVLPEQVIMLNEAFKLSDAPIMYNNGILVSLNDILKFISATINYDDSTSAITIKSNSMLLEVRRGENAAYVNDKSKNIPVPILTFDGKDYMSIEFFASSYGVGYDYIDFEKTIILYSNLNQN